MKTYYRDYFKIDEDYFPAVTDDLINAGKVQWEKFYPHETFVRLLKDTESVLSRHQKLSVWIEGAYGTGKSHAALTLKKLLEAPDSEMKSYFDQYKLDMDLFKKLQGLKDSGKILVVHRYGSSSIHGDRDLIVAIQESVKKALAENGIQNLGEEALKDAVIKWLSNEHNSQYFNSLILNDYKPLFGGDTVQDVIKKLETYSDENLSSLMSSIFRLSDEVGITALTLEIDGLIAWIRSVIEANHLKAIVFIWDEFTEYFKQNTNALTGFQRLVELSATDLFYMFIVTHKSAGLFHDADTDKKKILNRFVDPTCNIELPENMAFQLMAVAMKKNEDPVVLEEWGKITDDFNGYLHNSRQMVMKSAKIDEAELKVILPIHPYTALLLKHLSSIFGANQRSMFDFIKNDRGDDVKGFQWFIDTFGPEDDYPLLTIDMLWNFFYEKGKEQLSTDVRSILDCYNRQNITSLFDDQKRVLKTTLLLQAISQRMGDAVEAFIPNEKNIDYAYEGTPLEGHAKSVVKNLVDAGILYRKPVGNDRYQYTAVPTIGDASAIEKLKKQFRESKKTTDLVNEGELGRILDLPGALSLRYVVETTTIENFKNKINKLREKESQGDNKIYAVITFAKSDEERVSITKMLKEAGVDSSYNMLFIDASSSILGMDVFEQYIENMANSSYQLIKNKALSKQYEGYAREILEKWKRDILSSEFVLYSVNGTSERFVTVDSLQAELKNISLTQYPKSIEQYRVIENMYKANALKQGVECGATKEIKGTYASANINTKLDRAIGEAWHFSGEYWTEAATKNLLISQIKKEIEAKMHEGFSKEGRVSISEIYDMLKVKPYGFMPCNLTAFVLGFLLKEYANSNYRWTNDDTSDEMSLFKLKDMVEEVIKKNLGTMPKYKDKYIVATTAEEKAFSRTTAQVFNIPENECASVQQTRDKIRTKMKELSFPIWCVKEVLINNQLSTPTSIIVEIIDCYTGIANTGNISGNRSETDLAMEIGKKCIEYPNASNDLEKLITKENCLQGMINYIATYGNGELVSLSGRINDSGQYISALKSKFNAADANWVWNKETAEKQIDELILEYKIIAASNRIIAKTTSWEGMISGWCDNLQFLKVSFDTVKDYLEDLKTLLLILLSLKKFGKLDSSKKEDFLSLLENKGEKYNEFRKKEQQTALIRKACNFLVAELDDEGLGEVYFKLPNGVFTYDKGDYLKELEKEVISFKESQTKAKLIKLWTEKTDTKNPKEWSEKYKTPILCMLDEAQVADAKRAFEAINRKSPDNTEAEKAIEFLKKADFFAELNNQEKIEANFINKVVGRYKTMLPSVDEIRAKLRDRVADHPYEWYGNPSVEKVLREFAEYRYLTEGKDRVLEKIEGMDSDKLKIYLKELIKENMIVGIEILND